MKLSLPRCDLSTCILCPFSIESVVLSLLIFRNPLCIIEINPLSHTSPKSSPSLFTVSYLYLCWLCHTAVSHFYVAKAIMNNLSSTIMGEMHLKL